MNQSRIYSADRLHTDERRARWVVEQGHIRTVRIGRSHTASERMIEEAIAAMECRNSNFGTAMSPMPRKELRNSIAVARIVAELAFGGSAV